MLSCCRVCSKHPQHGHHAGLLISDMLHWSSGSWRCYQLLLLGQLPRGRLRPKPSHSPRSPFSPTEELCCASNPTPGTSYLWPCTAKHTITVPARWVRRAALFGRTLWLRFGIEVSLHMAFFKKNKANTLQGFPSNLREAVCHCPLLGGMCTSHSILFWWARAELVNCFPCRILGIKIQGHRFGQQSWSVWAPEVILF